MTLHRHSLGQAATLRTGVRIARPVLARRGRRVFAGATVATETSTNWSGYGGVASTALRGAEGTWTVPTVAVTTEPALYSASWVGLDGLDNSWLIQTGTEQDRSSGAAGGYYPWYEIITPTDPAPEIQIDSVVDPGDAMSANVAEVSTGTWWIYLSDTTQNWYFEQNFAYAGPAASAEWIEEAPTVDGQQSSPADWGTADFAHTSVYDGTNWFSTDLTSDDAIDLVDSNGNPLAIPGPISAPGAGGQSFADVFENPAVAPTTTTSTTPTSSTSTTTSTTTTTVPRPRVTAPSHPLGVTAWADRRAIRLRWRPPADDGGRPIARYIIREYTGGGLVRVLYSASPTIKVGRLVHTRRYLFTVAASNGKDISVPSAHTAALRPRS